MKLALVTIVVPDYDEAIRFYVGQAGFRLLEDSPLPNQKRWVRIGLSNADTAILLAQASNESQKAAIGNQTGGRVGFFIETGDFNADYQRMRENGVQFLEAPRHEPYGIVAVWRDPYGNKWDLIQLKAAT